MENQIMNNRQDAEVEIDLLELFYVLLRKVHIILLAGVIFAACALAWTTLFVTPQYTSKTTMYVLNRSENNLGGLTSQELQVGSYLTKDYKEIIQSNTVAEGVIRKLNLDMGVGELKGKMSVEVTSDTRIVSIKVEDPDPQQACDIANAFREVSSDSIKAIMDIEAVNLIDVAKVATSPSSPNVPKNVMAAGLLGCVMASGIFLMMHLLNDTIKTSEDVERYLGLSVLGSIPYGEMEKKKKKKIHRSIKGLRIRKSIRRAETKTGR